jgi:hypothetical protein
MSFLETNFKNIVLNHILEFEIIYNRAKVRPTMESIQDTKYGLLILLFDYYNIVSLFEKDEEIKNEKFKSIKEFEETILKLPDYMTSLDTMKEIYNQIIIRINEYLFKEKT